MFALLRGALGATCGVVTRRRAPAVAAALACLALLGCGPAALPASTPVVSPTVVPGGSPPVFAYYYLWWGESHWHDKLGPNYPYAAQPLPLPAKLDAGGCNAAPIYKGTQITDVPAALSSQDDPATILADVKAAAAGGLSGFIANWNGNGLASQTVTRTSNRNNQRLDALFKAVDQVNSEGIPFKLWISYKASANILPLDYILGDFAYLARKYGDDPAFDRRGGKPVVIWTGSRKYGLDTVKAVSAKFREKFFLIGDENWNSWGDGRADYFDGDAYYWSTQSPYTNPSSFGNLQDLAKMVRSSVNPDGSQKLWFAPLAPGYNSELLRNGTCVPRNDGETLRRLFEGNSQSKPDAWAFISWNEVAEGTYVEPLQRWGNLYLGYLKALVSR